MWLAPLAITAMATGNEPSECAKEEQCQQTWHAKVAGADVRLVDRRTTTGESDATLTLYVHGATWLSTDIAWKPKDVEMSTVHTVTLAARHETDVLPDKRSLILVQASFHHVERDRDGTHEHASDETIALICVADRPACTRVTGNDIRVHAGEVSWRDADGKHAEKLEFP